MAVYAVNWSRMVRAEAKVDGNEILTTAEGAEYQNPWLSVAKRASDVVARMAAVLGLDPSNRTRVAGAPTAGKKATVKTRPRTTLDASPPPDRN